MWWGHVLNQSIHRGNHRGSSSQMTPPQRRVTTGECENKYLIMIPIWLHYRRCTSCGSNKEELYNLSRSISKPQRTCLICTTSASGIPEIPKIEGRSDCRFPRLRCHNHICLNCKPRSLLLSDSLAGPLSCFIFGNATAEDKMKCFWSHQVY